jgi:hypothetical protein
MSHSSPAHPLDPPLVCWLQAPAMTLWARRHAVTKIKTEAQRQNKLRARRKQCRPPLFALLHSSHHLLFRLPSIHCISISIFYIITSVAIDKQT